MQRFPRECELWTFQRDGFRAHAWVRNLCFEWNRLPKLWSRRKALYHTLRNTVQSSLYVLLFHFCFASLSSDLGKSALSLWSSPFHLTKWMTNSFLCCGAGGEWILGKTHLHILSLVFVYFIEKGQRKTIYIGHKDIYLYTTVCIGLSIYIYLYRYR